MRWFSILFFAFILILLSGCQFAPPPATAVQAQASAVQSVITAPTIPTAEQAVQPADSSALPFALQSGYPQYLPAFTQPEAGCAWVGIGGQVLDQNNQPVEGVLVVVKGYFNGILIESMVLSGLSGDYGPSGFEIKIGDHSSDSSNALTIQLLNDRFEPLSDVYPIQTYDDCQRNLILYNFQTRSDQ